MIVCLIFLIIAGGSEVCDGLIKTLGKQVNSESAWHSEHSKVTSAALCNNFTEDCLHMLILPFNISASVSSLCLISLKLKQQHMLANFTREMIRPNNEKESELGGYIKQQPNQSRRYKVTFCGCETEPEVN